MIVKLQCEICFHELCTVNTELLKVPIKGDMFGPPVDWMPNPFHPEVDWRWMRCPMCRKRPFIEEGSFTTVEGNWLRVRDDGTIDTPVQDKSVLVVPQENTEEYAKAWMTGIDKIKPGPAEKIEPVKEQEKVPEPDQSPKKPHTLLDEVMRLHGLGMKPGQISREIEKAGHKLNHLQIGKKIKEELRRRESAA